VAAILDGAVDVSRPGDGAGDVSRPGDGPGAVSRRGARVRGLRDGEEVARFYSGRIKARARRALLKLDLNPRAELVEDVVQETYCRLLDEGGRRISACRAASEGEVVNYLGQVVERVVIDQLRRQLSQKRGGNRVLRIDGEVERRCAARLVDPRGTPEDHLLAAERRRLLFSGWREIGREPAGARNLRILRLAFVEGRSSREIARALGKIAPSSVDSVVHRLRRRLSEEGMALPRRSPYHPVPGEPRRRL
jgi:RNA polymerase sigma factor (sigma-70 family)